MNAAAGGGAAVVILTIVSVIGRAAILGARAQAQRQLAERRHQETLAAIRSRQRAVAQPARPAVLPAALRSASRPRPSAPRRATEPRDAIPERYIRAAAEAIIKTQYASATMLQRRLRVEYPDAVTILDELARRGVVGPAIPGTNVRQVVAGLRTWPKITEGWGPIHGSGPSW